MRFSVSTWNYLKAFGAAADLFAEVRGIRESGFQAELWLDWPRRETVFSRDAWADLRRLTAGMTGLSLHSSLIHKADLGILREELDLCAYLGGELVVFHPRSFGFPAGTWDSKLAAPFDPLDAELLLGTLACAREKKVTVALENGPLDLLAAVVDFVDGKEGSEVFGLCFDTSHANIHSAAYEDPVKTYLDILGPRIVHIHASDNLGRTDDHLVPGTGTIRWDSLLRWVKERDFPGSVVFELNTGDPADAAGRARDFFLSAMKE